MKILLASLLDELTKIAQERWLNVDSYKSRGMRGEMVLDVRGKKYWFPMPPKAYDTFRKKVRSSQSDALSYARTFIRSKKKNPYTGVWRGTKSHYVTRNKIPKGKKADPWDVSKDVRMPDDQL